MKYIQLFLACVGIAYCAVFGDFSMTERSTTSKDIYYDNVEYTDNVQFYGVHGLSLQYAGELHDLGEYYEISFDVVNSSSTNVEIAHCTYQKSDEYVEYQLMYADGGKVAVGDILKQGERKRLTYRVLYKNPIQSDSYELDSSFSIRYEQVL